MYKMYRVIVSVFIMISCTARAVDVPADVPTAKPVYAGLAMPDSDDVQEVQTKAPQQTSAMPLLSINTDVLDMNWTGAMELSDPLLRPTGIVLPFLESYPIDNLEVKLRLLNVRF